MLEQMVDAAQRLCPHVMATSNLRQELLAVGGARMTVPRSFISTSLLEQSGMDILNQIRCVLQVPARGRFLLEVPLGNSCWRFLLKVTARGSCWGFLLTVLAGGSF